MFPQFSSFLLFTKKASYYARILQYTFNCDSSISKRSESDQRNFLIFTQIYSNFWKFRSMNINMSWALSTWQKKWIVTKVKTHLFSENKQRHTRKDDKIRFYTGFFGAGKKLLLEDSMIIKLRLPVAVIYSDEAKKKTQKDSHMAVRGGNLC